MTYRLSAIAVALLVGHVSPAEAQTSLARERIVLRTPVGDVVLALFSEAAPRHADQLLTIARLGVLDTTHFSQVDPLSGVEVSNAAERERPLTIQQKAALAPIPPEPSALRLIRTAVTRSAVAKAPGTQPAEPYGRTGGSLFSILLTDMPGADGKQFVIGYVETGIEVIELIARVPRDPQGHPSTRIPIQWADVVDQDQLRHVELAPARPLPANFHLSGSGGIGATEARPLAGGLVLMIGIGCGAFFLSHRLSRRTLLSLTLLNVLLGGFLLLMIVTAPAQRRAWLALLVFGGVLALIKLMSRFEAPDAGDGKR